MLKYNSSYRDGVKWIKNAKSIVRTLGMGEHGWFKAHLFISTAKRVNVGRFYGVDRLI
jgi:hypothetical protein